MSIFRFERMSQPRDARPIQPDAKKRLRHEGIILAEHPHRIPLAQDSTRANIGSERGSRKANDFHSKRSDSAGGGVEIESFLTASTALRVHTVTVPSGSLSFRDTFPPPRGDNSLHSTPRISSHDNTMPSSRSLRPVFERVPLISSQ